MDRTRALGHRLLDRLAAGFAERGLEAFVVLFHGERYVHETDWREWFLITELARLELPWVFSRLRIREDAGATGRPVSAYYLQDGIGRGHYSEVGNQVVFTAFERGLVGRFDQ